MADDSSEIVKEQSESVSATNLKSLGDAPAFFQNQMYASAVARSQAMDQVLVALTGKVGEAVDDRLSLAQHAEQRVGVLLADERRLAHAQRVEALVQPALLLDDPLQAVGLLAHQHGHALGLALVVQRDPHLHLDLLAQIAGLFRDPELRAAIAASESAEEIHTLLTSHTPADPDSDS